MSTITFTVTAKTKPGYESIKECLMGMNSSGKLGRIEGIECLDGEFQVHIECMEEEDITVMHSIAKELPVDDYEIKGYMNHDAYPMFTDFIIESNSGVRTYADCSYDEIDVEGLDYEEFVEELAERYEDFEDDDSLIRNQVSEEEYQEFSEDDSAGEWFVFVIDEETVTLTRPIYGDKINI